MLIILPTPTYTSVWECRPCLWFQLSIVQFTIVGLPFLFIMFPKRNNKRFFDYESASNVVLESAMITSSIIPTTTTTVRSSTTLTSIIMTTTTTTSVHPTSTTVSYIYIHKNKFLFFLNLDYSIHDMKFRAKCQLNCPSNWRRQQCLRMWL